MTTDPQPATTATSAQPVANTPVTKASAEHSAAPTRDTAYLAALTTYTRSLTPSAPASPDTTADPIATLLSLAAQAGYPSATADPDLAAELAHTAALSPTPDVLDATYQLAFTPGMPATAHPGLMYLLLTLGFQVDDYTTVLGSYCVDVKYRGLVKQVVGEIKDAPMTTALLGGYREHEADNREAGEQATVGVQEEQADKKEEEEEQAKVHEHDKLYHVEMDVSDEAWRWSWDRVKQIPGLATFMQV